MSLHPNKSPSRSASPLPKKVTDFLIKNAGGIKRLFADRKAEEQGLKEADAEDAASEEQDDVEADTALESNVLTLEEFKKQLTAAFGTAKHDRDVWTGVVDEIAAFALKRTGPNLLIDDADILGHFLKADTCNHVILPTRSLTPFSSPVLKDHSAWSRCRVSQSSSIAWR